MSEIIDIAETWLDTPFKHQGRLKHIGVDCVGLIEEVAREAGMLPRGYQRILDYPRLPKSTMKDLLDQYLKRSDRSIKKEKILFFGFSKKNHVGQHLGIVVSDTHFIHAFQNKGKVVKTRIDEKWRKRILRIYEYKDPI